MIEITEDNHKELYSKYAQQILSGEARIIHNIYMDGQFVTDCYSENIHEVLDAYSPLGTLKIESYLNVGTEHSVRGE